MIHDMSLATKSGVYLIGSTTFPVLSIISFFLGVILMYLFSYRKDSRRVN